MAINFPATPSTNQTYTFNGRTWTWNGVGWQATGSTGLTVYTKTDFTATAGQTSFSCTYTVGFVDVYYNGSKLSTSEYTATTGSTVVLGTACALGDIVETIAWTISSSFNPSLGSASATSLAIGGATIGSNALAVTGTTTLSSTLTTAAGTASVAPVVLTSGTLLTAAAAGALEYDGVCSYETNETTSGRGLIPVEQYFHLTSAGTGITTIANFFGPTSNISLVANAYYEIEIVCFFTMGSTASVVTWTLANSAAPTYMNLRFEMSPNAGIVVPPGNSTTLVGNIIGGVTAAQNIVTGSALALNTKQYAKFNIILQNGAGTSLKIQCAETTTTTALTPNIGSYWKCKRIPAGNVGTFAA